MLSLVSVYTIILGGTKMRFKESIREWLQHLQRMPSEIASKQLLHYKPTGRRGPGRPRKREHDVRRRNKLTSTTLADDDNDEWLLI
jgi:hypothetical protein